MERRPYLIEGATIGLVASLAGGNVMAHLVDSIAHWMKELQLPIELDRDELHRRVRELGAQLRTTSLKTRPIFQGERHAPDQKGSMSQMDFKNFTLGDLYVSFFQGMLTNLLQQVPKDRLAKVKRWCGTGRALHLNLTLVHDILPQLELVSQGSTSAAVGAARFQSMNL